MVLIKYVSAVLAFFVITILMRCIEFLFQFSTLIKINLLLSVVIISSVKKNNFEQKINNINIDLNTIDRI